MSVSYCWLLPNGSTLDVPYGHVHGTIAIHWAYTHMLDKMQEIQRSEPTMWFIDNLNWIRIHMNSFQIPDSGESALSRISNYIRKNIGEFNTYREFTLEIGFLGDSFTFSKEELEEVDFNFQRAIAMQKRRKRFMVANYQNLLLLRTATKMELESRYRFAGEIYQERVKKAICFINALNERYPKTEFWRGNQTHDFGNGVTISITNKDRDIYSDMLFDNSFDPEDERRVDIFYVENIQSQDRGKGYASAAIQKLVELANECGVILRLYPKPTDKKGLKQKQLSKWYQSKGWKSMPKDETRDNPNALYLERNPEKKEGELD